MSLDSSIRLIDTLFQQPQFDAAYLVVEQGRGAFIDCGTRHSVPQLLATLAEAGLTPGQVDWLVLTHVHLDHAGGAGALMHELPNARLVVHPRGARHMIDPSALIAGATAVYGEEEMARSYGEIVPVAAERVVASEDGHVVDLAGRALRCLHTPGHARHHQAIWDERSSSWFCGDAFGLSYRALDSTQGAFILPTTTPVQFDPQAMRESIDRMLSFQPQTMYLTHYGPVAPPVRLAEDLYEQIEAMVAIAQGCARHADRHRCLVAALTGLYLERARQHGCALDDAEIARLLALDIELNAQGLGCWLDRPAR